MSTILVAESSAASLPEPTPQPSPVLLYEFGPFRVDLVGRRLLKDGELVPLTAKVFDTLLALIRQHENPVSKEDIINAVWPGTFVSDDSLVQNISTLRRALGDDPSQPRYIVTLSRRGYRFIAPITEHTKLDLAERAALAKLDAPIPVAASVSPTPVAVRGMAWNRWALVGVAFVAGLSVAGASALVAYSRPETAALPVRFQETAPPGHNLRGGAAISPDGRQLAFTTQDANGSRLWLRALDAPTAHALPGTEDAAAPFWSPDGQFVGFDAGGEIKRLEISTGLIRSITSTHRGRPLGASWGPGDIVLFGDLGKIFAVPSGGGVATEIANSGTNGEGGELRWPQMVADGKHFVFFESGEAGKAGTFLGTLGSRETVALIPGFRATYAPPNYLLYVRDGTLLAQAFDIGSGQLDGAPMAVPGEASASTTFSASASGVLVTANRASKERLVWRDRAGNVSGNISIPKQISDIALSPDGNRALVASLEAGTYELWLVDLVRSVSTKVATDATFPAWAPDGTRFAFTHVSADGADVYVRSATGAPQESIWLKTKELKSVSSWSPDGRFIVFAKFNSRAQTSRDLWVLPTSGQHKAFPLLETKALERGGVVSPDGRWIAYDSDETGVSEVYVQSFPSPGARVRVSTSGGNHPHWRRDGRELIYVSQNHHVMSVPLQTGAEFRPSKPESLFPVPITASARQVQITPDGQRFLAVDVDPSNPESHLNLLTNWTSARRP